MQATNTKYVIELKKGHKIEAIKGIYNVVGGEWEIAKDNLGVDRIFEYYFEAHREMSILCPESKFYGGLARVKEVELIPITQKNKEK